MEIYDRKYFLSECDGYKSFIATRGIKLTRRLNKIYERIIELKPKRILDFGCGRGELALVLSLSGIETYGVDNSCEAIEISNETKKYWLNTNPEMKLDFIKLNNYLLPFKDDFFDVVVISDTIEHLKEEEISKIFIEIYRVLKKSGFLIIHTSPNKIFLNFGLKIYWLLALINGLILPFNMKKMLPYGLKPPYHINEQSCYSIKKYLTKAKFKETKLELWKNPHYVYYFLKEDRYIKLLNKIYWFLPIKQLFYSDIFAMGKK